MRPNSNQPNIVVIGGGTGSFTLLRGLKKYTDNITALVNMSDDGGSTGQLRDELGVLPPGDVRQCLVALSDTQKARDLFTYRFDEGSFDGHSFGNLFISAVEKMTDSFEQAIEVAADFLRVKGQVIPITLDKVTLHAKLDDGHVEKGEHRIGNMDLGSHKRPILFFEPPARLNPSARKAIADADVIVIAPGNLYGSLAPALIVDGMCDALKNTKATVLHVSNLVTKPGQTDEFSVADYADEIERFCGADILDYVIFNTDEPTKRMRDKYVREGEYMLEFDLDELSQKHYHAVGLPLIDKSPVTMDARDKIAHSRSLIRHNSDTVAREVMKIYFS